MNLGLFNNLINNIKESDFVQNFINELTNFIENNSKLNITKTDEYSKDMANQINESGKDRFNQDNKYSNYWVYQNFMEDNVAATLGISRWSANTLYRNQLSKAIDDSILKLSEIEGTLYRKKFKPNGLTYDSTYNVDKFENGKIEHLVLSKDKVPSGFDDEDIIFQYKSDGEPKVREDLRNEVIRKTSENMEYLKVQENNRALDYKKEGHIYQAGENDGYIFLKDLTERRDYVIEDIDFVVDSYAGEGKYQVIDGIYKKMSE